MIIKETKRCTICNEEKEIKEFDFQQRKKDKCLSYCQECRKEYHRKYYEKNKEKRKQEILEWQKENPNKVKKHKKKWRLKKTKDTPS